MEDTCDTISFGRPFHAFAIHERETIKGITVMQQPNQPSLAPQLRFTIYAVGLAT